MFNKMGHLGRSPRKKTYLGRKNIILIILQEMLVFLVGLFSFWGGGGPVFDHRP